MVTRQVPGGGEHNLGAEQAITVSEAIDIFTINAARHMGTDDHLGQIQANMLADLIVIDQNPYSVEPSELHKTKVQMTFINGELVYDAAGAH